MSAFVDTMRSIGLDIETAVALEQELDQVPKRTKEVFLMRAMGYTQEEIGEMLGITQQGVFYHQGKCLDLYASLLVKVPKNRA